VRPLLPDCTEEGRTNTGGKATYQEIRDKPSYTVSIMEFCGDKVARETQYFADPFPAPAFRAKWVERMPA